jgi:hypothetical protein
MFRTKARQVKRVECDSITPLLLTTLKEWPPYALIHSPTMNKY